MSPRMKNIYLQCTYETFVECIGVQTHTGRVIGKGGGVFRENSVRGIP